MKMMYDFPREIGPAHVCTLLKGMFHQFFPVNIPFDPYSPISTRLLTAQWNWPVRQRSLTTTSYS